MPNEFILFLVFILYLRKCKRKIHFLVLCKKSELLPLARSFFLNFEQLLRNLVFIFCLSLFKTLWNLLLYLQLFGENIDVYLGNFFSELRFPFFRFSTQIQWNHCKNIYSWLNLNIFSKKALSTFFKGWGWIKNLLLTL